MSDVNISAAIAGTKSEIDLAAFPDFPIQIFDPIIQELILVISSVIGAPASMAASAFIMLSAACIGRKRGLVIGSRIEHANMFMLHIGQSGTGKSPTMKTIFSELSRYELERYKEYVKELDLYNAQKKNKKNKQPLIEPLLKQVTTDDATTQALLRILHANPAGIMVKVDEVDGLFSNKKIEKKRLLTGYNVGEWRSNRVKNTNNYFIPAGAISILGLMTKETLIENVGPEDVRSGLVPRFCFILDNKVDLPDFSSDTIKDKGLLRKNLWVIFGSGKFPSV